MEDIYYSRPNSSTKQNSPNNLSYFCPFDDRIKRGASAISRNREILASSELRPKSMSKSSRALPTQLHPYLRAASSKTPLITGHINLQNANSAYNPIDSEASKARRKSMINNLKNANPARY